MFGQEEATLGQDRLDPGRPVRPMFQLLDQRPDVFLEGIMPTEVAVQLQRQDLGMGQGVALALSHGG